MLKTYLAAIGIIFLTLALALFTRRMAAVMRGESALGQVKGHEARTSDEETYYLPIVEFADSSGAWHRFTSVAGDSTRSPPVGATVTVRYLSEDPKQAYIESFPHMWGAPLGCAVLGAVAGIAAWQ